MQKQLSEFMQKEVTPKEFMTMVGFGAASLFGFGSIIRMLSGNSSSHKQASQGYGGSRTTS